MRIESIYINTYRKDFFLAKICIASIRYWYPEMPIYLIKDMGAGDFSTSVVQEKLNVKILDTGGKTFGWGFGKFEPLFAEKKEHFLFMDADTVMIGPVIDQVIDMKEEFLVDDEDLPIEKFKLLYYDPLKVDQIYPGFQFPGYGFNTGQWFGTSGLLNRTDFDALVKLVPNPVLTYPEIFKQADQGVFNFILHKLVNEEKLSLKRIPLMIWPDSGKADFIDLSSIKARKGVYPRIIHWAGMKSSFDKLPRKDILDFYQHYYYQLVGHQEKYKDRFLAMKNTFSDFSNRLRNKLQTILPS